MAKKNDKRVLTKKAVDKPRLWPDYLLCKNCTETSDSSSPSPSRSESNSPTELSSPQALGFEDTAAGRGLPAEPADWGQVRSTAEQANCSSLIPFVKTAEWLLSEPREASPLEPLVPDTSECYWAVRLLEHVDKRIFEEQRPLSVVAFDLALGENPH